MGIIRGINSFRLVRKPLFLLSSFLLISSLAEAQRTLTYPELAMRPRESTVFFTFNPVPGFFGDSTRFAVSFKVSYDYLSFMKPLDGDQISIPEGFEYYSFVELTLEVGEADSTQKPGVPEKARRSGPPGQSAEQDAARMNSSRFRTFWKGYAYARNYAESQLGNRYLEGIMFITLPPGAYDYLFIFKESGRSQERAGQIRRMIVSKKERNNYFAPVLLEKATPPFPLMNLSGNVAYGSDFVLSVTVPAGSSQIQKLLVRPAPVVTPSNEKRKTAKPQNLPPPPPPEPVTTITLDNATRYPGYKLSFPNNSEANALVSPDSLFDLLIFPVKGSSLRNGFFNLELTDSSGKQLWNWRILTQWRDMPRSLLNLDVSIDMLKFVVSKEQLKTLKTGTSKEKEQRFRDFWAKKDPTPETEFNELLDEYYRRIDYTFETFSSLQKPGYESDQGQVYIRMGPPQKITRDFNSGDAALEIWTYPNNQEIIFRATSGFGDFERIK